MAVPVYGWVRHIWMGRVYEMGFKAMSKPTSVDIKETVKRFCRTDKASDNLVDIINRLIVEARVDELKSISGFSLGEVYTVKDVDKSKKNWTPQPINDRIKQLTKELGDSNE